MITQMAWTEILGDSTERCVVLGKDIVRYNERYDKFTVLWTFNSNRHAYEVFQKWNNEIIMAMPWS